MTALVFASFHSKKHGGVALLTAAYAMSALIPSKGLFREEAVKVTSSDGSFLFVTMVGTFLGGLKPRGLNTKAFIGLMDAEKWKFIPKMVKVWF